MALIGAIAITALILSIIGVLISLYCLVRILTPVASNTQKEVIQDSNPPVFRRAPNAAIEEIADIPDEDELEDEEGGEYSRRFGL